MSLYLLADSIWNDFKGTFVETNQSATEVECFESTYNNQMSGYDGKLVREMGGFRRKLIYTIRSFNRGWRKS